MNTLHLMAIFGIFALAVSAVSAVDITGWNKVEVDEALVNSSSNTIFTVMSPPGLVNKTIDSPLGAITIFVNESSPDDTLSIWVMDNPIGQMLNETNSEKLLGDFMLGANLTPIEGTEPGYLDDGGILNYGMNGDEVGGVYILSTDEKVIVVSGFYKTMDDATAGTETLALIAATVEISPNSEEQV